MDFKLVESLKYSMGENHYQWYLHTGLYQNRNSYYYIIFDNDSSENVITSCIVGSKTINDIEKAITEAMSRPNKIETIEDFFNELQKGFYGTMFKWQEVTINV